ncbi:MAG: hypothetical protein AAF725_02970 [Acidobacteriota bacterium]
MAHEKTKVSKLTIKKTEQALKSEVPDVFHQGTAVCGLCGTCNGTDD